MRRDTPAARRWMTAVLAVFAVSGYLLVSGALDPVLSAAITLALGGPPDSATPAPGPRMGKVADWQYFDDRPEWSSVRGVPQVPSPVDPVEPTRPSVAPPENPIHFIFGGPPPMPHYSLAPAPSCPQQHGPASFVEQFVVTKTGPSSASVTWWDLGDPDTTAYEVIAEPDYINIGNATRTLARPRPVQVNVIPPKACRQMTETVTGLTTGLSYFFVLQATNLSSVQHREYHITRATSESVLIS